MACSACHPKEALGDDEGDGGDGEAIRLLYESLECRNCHEETLPTGHLADLEEGVACENCHSTEGLQGVIRDHEKSKLPLTGRHLEED